MDNEVERRLCARGLGRVAEPVLRHALEGLRLTARAADETELPIGASKIGGLPDLPLDAKWPRSHRSAHAFVAQVNLTDAAGYACSNALPSMGLLSLFYENDEQDDEDEDRPRCTVLYWDGEPSLLERRRAPRSLAISDRFTACAVKFSPITTLPAPGSSAVEGLGLTEEERQAYIDVYLGWDGDFYARGQTPEHRLLGHPYNLEGDARVDCLVASKAHEWGDESEWPDDAAIEREAADWVLLLQLDSDSSARMDWNGGGLIYFCIPRKALAARDFGAVWATAQFL